MDVSRVQLMDLGLGLVQQARGDAAILETGLRTPHRRLLGLLPPPRATPQERVEAGTRAVADAFQAANYLHAAGLHAAGSTPAAGASLMGQRMLDELGRSGRITSTGMVTRLDAAAEGIRSEALHTHLYSVAPVERQIVLGALSELNGIPAVAALGRAQLDDAVAAGVARTLQAGE